MASLLASIRQLNNFGDQPIGEPFAGGAGASLTLLYLEHVHRIYINDADPAIHDFWWALTNQSKQFLQMLSGTDVTIGEWRRQRATYRNKRRISRLRRGFATFFLSRCNHSGIIMNGGPIGGIKQRGKWRLNARFNKEQLHERCEKIAQYRDRIGVSCHDGIRFIEKMYAKPCFLFIDPPYFKKGPTLYLNALNEEYHAELAARLRTMTQAPWVLTYDDCPEIRRMYRGWASVRPFSLRYAAAERRQGKELLITPKWMMLPKSQKSNALTW